MAYVGEQKRDYQRRWIAARRREWIEKHGPCVDCGSFDDLEIDHKDPKTKEFNIARIWSWKKERRDKELEKCVVRCHNCHADKTYIENIANNHWDVMKIKEPNGMAWCTGHKVFEPIDCFGKRANRGKNGLREYCKQYRNDLLKIGKQV